jgi:DNA invertase Pin-like site-specific DNA recombinase
MVLRRKVTAGSVGAWGYVRYSTDKQGENSTERQVAAIHRWADRTGTRLLGVFFDFEVSRTIDHGDRPGMALALDTIRQQHSTVLVAETVSRLVGDPTILGAIRRVLAKSGARLATADETGNADLDEDRQDFDALFSKREIKQIKSRTKGALAVKRMRGEVVGVLPYGFGRKADGQHVKDPRTHAPRCEAGCVGCLHVEPNAAEQAVIHRAKALSDEGSTVRAIAAQLTAEGVRGRTGNPLSHTQVHRFLRPLLEADAAAE